MVLGVTCSSKAALLAVVDGGDVINAPVYRIEVAALLEASAELEATLEEIGRALSQIKPDLIVLLLPEQSPRFKHTYSQIAPRVTLETLFRLAAVRAEIAIEVMSRATVRSKLELPRKGDLASHTAARVKAAVGPYWNTGRNVAALAGLAGEKA
jgi:hypothetical protein